MGSFSSKTPSSLEALGVAHRHSDVNEDHNMNIDNDLHHQIQPIDTHINESTTTITTITTTIPIPNGVPEEHLKEDHEVFDEMSEGEASEEATEEDEEEQSPKPITNSEEEDEKEKHPNKKQKSLSTLIPQTPNAVPPEEEESIGALEALEALGTLETTTPTTPATATLKKPKKKSNMNNVWTKSTSRKGKKKNRVSGNNVAAAVDTVAITPVARFPDRSDDSPEMTICLSKVYKAEKVELSDDRLVAGSSKGYRMVRATRGVEEGAWYFEIKVEKLGQTGHTRLGWSTEKGDLQAPVGYDGNSFGYRDVDGSKVHKAMRDKYGDSGYAEGDVIGFYISLPDGARYAPKQPHFVLYKGQKFVYATDGKEELPQVIPGSEISFFKNGVCQGVAFKDLHGGRYYPAASMYTLPNEPNCVVKFNFGPDFEYFPQDFDCRPFPRPMIEVPYLPFDGRIENGVSDEKKS